MVIFNPASLSNITNMKIFKYGHPLQAMQCSALVSLGVSHLCIPRRSYCITLGNYRDSKHPGLKYVEDSHKPSRTFSLIYILSLTTQL